MDDKEESNDVEQQAESKIEIPKVLSFRERMKRLSPHQLPLKERMKDQTINYIDLFHSDPLPSRLEEDRVSQVCRRLKSRRVKSKDNRATLDE